MCTYNLGSNIYQMANRESKRRTNHYDVFCKGIDLDGCHLLTVDHNLHRKRRKPLEPFLSRMEVARLQPILAAVALKLESRCSEHKETHKMIRLDHTFVAFTSNIIGRIYHPDFAPDCIVNYIPESIFFKYIPQAPQNIALITRNKCAAKSHNDITHTSLFSHHQHRLAKKAQLLLGAGTATTARTISLASYYILANPEIKAKLQVELKDPMANWRSWLISKPSSRSLYATLPCNASPRISPDLPIQYKRFTIPAGTLVGMSAYLMHSDPSVYLDPKSFPPDRWLGTFHPSMYWKYVPFTHGSRNCLGREYVTLHYAINPSFWRLYRPNGPGLELCKADETDVIHVHDFMAPLPKLSTERVRALVW
ncbi:cytochrome P450 [Aspergillus alliaceus]|uniref:Cytochrome P450 n=1 Tax=Petromyces alliaceus TaxID=209559 RepID=A0A5N7BV84_PETAA|nr:cytochrome P450 [Aspergillus alliaceus]